MKKIENINRNAQIGTLDSKELDSVRKFYKNYGFKSIRPDWHAFYSRSSGLFSNFYVPEDVFYTLIEPRLNNVDFGKPLMDKRTKYLNCF